MIKSTIIWNAEFETQEELDTWITNVCNVHKQQYGTNAVEEALRKDNVYKGKINRLALIINNKGLKG